MTQQQQKRPRYDTTLNEVKDFIRAESAIRQVESHELDFTRHAKRAIRELLESGDIILGWSHLYDKHNYNTEISERPKVGEDMFPQVNRILNNYPYYITCNNEKK